MCNQNPPNLQDTLGYPRGQTKQWSTVAFGVSNKYLIWSLADMQILRTSNLQHSITTLQTTTCTHTAHTHTHAHTCTHTHTHTTHTHTHSHILHTIRFLLLLEILVLSFFQFDLQLFNLLLILPQKCIFRVFVYFGFVLNALSTICISEKLGHSNHMDNGTAL